MNYVQMVHLAKTALKNVFAKMEQNVLPKQDVASVPQVPNL